MPDLSHLLVFIAAGWLLNLTPGPDVLCIVSHSLRQGARSGVVAGLGVTTGCFLHIFAAAAGVGALLATSSAAFAVLKWAGASYLVWMGVRSLWSGAAGQDIAQAAGPAPADRGPADLRSAFLSGFWTNALNPKVALFFLAFVPQFIAPESSDKALAFVLLGILFNINSIPVNTGWALLAAWLAGHRAVRRGMRWLDRLAGLMFIGFGVRLALADAPTR